MTGKGKFAGLLGALNSGKEETQKSDIQEDVKSGNHENVNEHEPVVRKKYSTLIDPELLKELQVYAIKAELKDWEVVGQALREFLEKKNS